MQNRENHRMALIEAFKSKKAGKDPVRVAKRNFKDLVQVSLDNLVAAGNMAHDSSIPECLSVFAREISCTDNGVPLRPGLRRLVQSWLEDEEKASEWFYFLKKNNNTVDSHLRGFLYPMLKTLLTEQDSDYPAEKGYETLNNEELEK